MSRISVVLFCLVIAVVTLWCSADRIYSFLTVSEPLQRADAIVLLSGSYRERAPEAARLFRDGIASRIILTNDGVGSSWSQRNWRNLFEIEWATELLVTRGVPRQAIVPLPFIGSGTMFDAAAVRAYCLQNDIHSLLLVTSGYHTRRALWTFRQVFRQEPVTIGIVPVASPGGCGLTARWRVTQEVCSETVKGIYYYLRFKMFRTFGLPLSSPP